MLFCLSDLGEMCSNISDNIEALTLLCRHLYFLFSYHIHQCFITRRVFEISPAFYHRIWIQQYLLSLMIAIHPAFQTFQMLKHDRTYVLGSLQYLRKIATSLSSQMSCFSTGVFFFPFFLGIAKPLTTGGNFSLGICLRSSGIMSGKAFHL